VPRKFPFYTSFADFPISGIHRMVLFCFFMVLPSGRADNPSWDLSLALPPPDRTEFFATGIEGFSGEPISVPLSMDAELGTNWDLTAEWMLVAGNRAAPLPGKQLVAENLQFSDRTGRKFSVEVNMPEVQRESKVILRIVATNPDAEDSALRVASFAGVAFPPPESEDGLVARLRKFAQQSRLFLAGESPEIREFFNNQKIPFEDFDSKMPPADPLDIVLYQGDNQPKDLFSRVRCLWFAPLDPLLPGVFPPPLGSNKPTRITLPVLNSLEKSPLKQKAFLQLLQNQQPEHNP
jgi:hypothetical protein